MRIFFRLAGWFCLSMPSLWAGSLSGKWEATLRSPGREVRLFLEFQQQGQEFAGAFGLRADFLSPLSGVRQAGNVFSFDLQIPRGPAGAFEGVLDGNRASGQFTSTGPGQSASFEMARSGPASRLPAFAAPAGPSDRLAALSDEFDDPATFGNWESLSGAEDWPDRVETIDVNSTNPSQLYVTPKSGAWWAAYHGVYFFKKVEGDFVITTRVKVTGKSGGEPTGIWTLSGLLVRAPVDLKTPRELRKENWLYLMTGRGPSRERVIDAKSTLDGSNEWDITPAGPGWYELRIVRLGPLFLALVRPDGGPWTLRKRIVREDLPATLQAGINLTCDFKLSSTMPAARYNAELFPGRSSPDSATAFDFVRFNRPAGAVTLRKKLAGKEIVAIPDAELLALFQ